MISIYEYLLGKSKNYFPSESWHVKDFVNWFKRQGVQYDPTGAWVGKGKLVCITIPGISGFFSLNIRPKESLF